MIATRFELNEKGDVVATHPLPPPCTGANHSWHQPSWLKCYELDDSVGGPPWRTILRWVCRYCGTVREDDHLYSDPETGRRWLYRIAYYPGQYADRAATAWEREKKLTSRTRFIGWEIYGQGIVLPYETPWIKTQTLADAVVQATFGRGDKYWTMEYALQPSTMVPYELEHQASILRCWYPSVRLVAGHRLVYDGRVIWERTLHDPYEIRHAADHLFGDLCGMRSRRAERIRAAQGLGSLGAELFRRQGAFQHGGRPWWKTMDGPEED